MKSNYRSFLKLNFKLPIFLSLTLGLCVCVFTHTSLSPSAVKNTGPKHTGTHTVCGVLYEVGRGQSGWPVLLQSVISVFDQRATGISPQSPDRQAAVNTRAQL